MMMIVVFKMPISAFDHNWGGGGHYYPCVEGGEGCVHYPSSLCNLKYPAKKLTNVPEMCQ